MNDRISPELLHQLLVEHASPLELFARQWSASPEDCVQEAMVALANCKSVPAEPIAWLYRVVRNRAISRLREDERRKRREVVAAEMATCWFERSAANSFDAEDATRALATLDDELREVVIARIWGGLSFEQIGEVIDASAATAFRRYESALRILRTRLEASWLTSKNSIQR